MATKKEIALQKESNELQKASNELQKANLDLTKDELAYGRDIQNLLKDQTKELQFQRAEKREIVNIGNSLQRVAQDIFNIEVSELGTSRGIKNVLKQREELSKRKLQLASLEGTITEKDEKVQKEINDNLKAQIGFTEKLEARLQNRLELSEKIANKSSVKNFQGISDLAKLVPGLNVLAQPFQDAADAARQVKIDQEEFKDALKTGKGLTQETIKRLGFEKKITGEGVKATAQAKAQGLELSKLQLYTSAGRKGLAALIPAIKVAAKSFVGLSLATEIFKVNTEVVELQKSMALTSSEALTLRQEFSNVANESGNVNVTTSALLTTVSELSKQFGFIAMFSADTLVTTTKLTQQVGISAEAAGNLAAASVSTGENFEEQYKNALGTSYELQRQEGVQFDLRQILEESGKITGTIRANLGTNVESIAKAVTQAKLFGASLNDVAGASKALLDFESSITAELEAELLLGKNINLETARQASLNGDLVTVAKELRKEAGDYTEFSKMNVIQQEALAKAMGMQSDQLADILFQQDIQGKTAKELRALGKEDLATKLEAQTVQDKFNKSIVKLQSLLGDVVTAFTPIIDVLGSALEAITFITSKLSFMTGTLAGAAAGSAFGLPGAAIGLLLGAASDINRGMSTADDAIIPTTGYGDTIIKSGKDTLALNNQDSVAVVAGTNLGGGSNKTGERTNQLLESLIMQNSKKPELSPVGLYEIQ